MKEFTNQVVFVTGGTSGMGLASAKALASRGARIAVFSSNAKAAECVLHEIDSLRPSGGQRVAWYQLDVADRTQVLSAFARAATECGPPDIVINMAGIGGLAALIDMPFEMFDRIMKVNVYGTRHVVEAALASMRPRGRGKILLVGSMAGFAPVYGYTAYGTSKFAVVGFAESLSYELKPLGITVACFCPGEVETPGLASEREHSHPAAMAMKKLGGTISTDVAVRALLDGISNDRFLIIPGVRSKVLYWLKRLVPNPLWNAVARGIATKAST